MPSTLFVPDTTVVSNFALTGKMGVLEGAQRPGLGEMAHAVAIFGEPLFPDAGEHVNILVLQGRMRQPGDRDTAHLGEAETITIITTRGLKAAFVTDDKDAQRQARSENIPVYDTWHILKLAVATGHLSEHEFRAAYHDGRREPRPPAVQAQRGRCQQMAD